MGLSILWVPIIKESQGTELFVYIQEISSFLQPPIIAVFIAGLFWPRANELVRGELTPDVNYKQYLMQIRLSKFMFCFSLQGAFAGLVVGIVTGLVRFGIQYAFKGPTCEDPTDYRPAIVRDFHYLYFGMFLFAFTLLTVVVVSLLTKPIDKKHVSLQLFGYSGLLLNCISYMPVCSQLYRLTFWTRRSVEKRIDLDTEEDRSPGNSSH